MTEVEVERLRRQLAELQATEEREATPVSNSVPEVGAPERLGPADLEAAQPAVMVEVALEVADLDPVESVSAVGSAAPESGAAAHQPSASNEPAHDSAKLSEEGQVLYDRGYTLFHQGHYLDSETVFQQFLASFGATDLGDNAQFWIGEARYAREDLSGAMAAFGEVVSRYPEGNKVPDAQLKVGDCQFGLGDIEGARRSYQAVVADFPFSAAAAVAEDRLRELP
jgi:tol-pal system protein YbgF